MSADILNPKLTGGIRNLEQTQNPRDLETDDHVG